MIDRVRTLVVDGILSPVRRVLARESTSEGSDDRSDSDLPGPPRKQSPEDRVLELLEERGGRMWQQSIVSETGYSEPHVSRLLCRMEDDDLVDRHWHRGQKVVVLDGGSIDAAGSASAASA